MVGSSRSCVYNVSVYPLYSFLARTGQLPCLEHGQRSVSGLASIIKFVEHLDGASAPNTSIIGQEKAQSVARIAQIEAELGDLVVSILLYDLHLAGI